MPGQRRVITAAEVTQRFALRLLLYVLCATVGHTENILPRGGRCFTRTRTIQCPRGRCSNQNALA